MDNIVIAISYTSIVLALYWYQQPRNPQPQTCCQTAAKSTAKWDADLLQKTRTYFRKGVSYCGRFDPCRHPPPLSWYRGGRAGPGQRRARIGDGTGEWIPSGKGWWTSPRWHMVNGSPVAPVLYRLHGSSGRVVLTGTRVYPGSPPMPQFRTGFTTGQMTPLFGASFRP